MTSANASTPRHSARNDFRGAWRLFRQHWRVLVGAELVLFALWATLEISVIASSWLATRFGLEGAGVAVNVLLHAAYLVVFSGFVVGLHRIALDAADGKRPSLRSLPRSLSAGPSYLLALFLYLLVTLAGTVALVAPGIYVAVRWAFFGQLLADGRSSAVRALRESASLGKDRWGSLFVLFLLGAALNIAGAAIVGIGFFVSLPVGLLAASLRYRAMHLDPARRTP